LDQFGWVRILKRKQPPGNVSAGTRPAEAVEF